MSEHGDPPLMDDAALSYGHRPLADDSAVPHRTFFVIGAALACIAAIYWFTAYENAGTTMLLLSSMLALWTGTYLWIRGRVRSAGVPPTPTDPEALETEHEASAWPFALGLGMTLLANGLVFGYWILLPGIAVTAMSVAGWVQQSR